MCSRGDEAVDDDGDDESYFRSMVAMVSMLWSEVQRSYQFINIL